MAELLPEDLAERQAFDRDTQSIHDGDSLQHVEAILGTWSRMLPQQGSMSALCVIMSAEVARARRKLEVAHTAPIATAFSYRCYCEQCRGIRAERRV